MGASPALHDNLQASLPLVTHEDLDPILRSGAYGAMASRRVEQMTRFGHTPAGDLANPVDYLPRQARARIDDALAHLGHGDHRIADAHRETILCKLEVAGALLAAAIDRINAQGKESDDAHG